MVNDVKRAYFHAKCTRDVYVQLPSEDIGAGEEEMCGKLRLSMYGTRDAARNWEETCKEIMVELGFQQGRSSGSVFFHPERQIRTVIHGDDFLSSGARGDLRSPLAEGQPGKEAGHQDDCDGPGRGGGSGDEDPEPGRKMDGRWHYL